MEMTGEPMDLLRRTLGGYARHANFAGVLVIGLGCERNQLAGFMKEQGFAPGPRFHPFLMQETGGTRKTVEAGVAAVEEMLPAANTVKRQAVSARHLKAGLQCGGSDGFSSITATRARSREVGEKLLERIRWWKDEYATGRDAQINGRVSPGNQVGGLANIFEKSLGSSMKGGTTGLMEVYRYAEPVTQPGFVFMDTPGFDPCSATGQIAGGANVVLFTTGRGSMFGAKPVPSIKLATNTRMYRKLSEDMDLNCGEILDGTATMQEIGQRIFDLMLRVASGERSKSEELGLGDHEFVPWNIGIVS